jgi:hypothetical protein
MEMNNNKFIPDAWQRKVLNCKGNILLRTGRQVGKSEVIAEKVKILNKKYNNITILIIASAERQSSLLFEKIKAKFMIDENQKIEKVMIGKEFKTLKKKRVFEKEFSYFKEEPTLNRMRFKNGNTIICVPTGRTGAFIRGFTIDYLIADEAARIYDYVLQRGMVRGRSMESVIASCLYAACRSYNIPRTLDEMATASDIERKEIGRTYRFIVRKLGIKVKQSSPKDYISRFSSVLNLSPKTQNDALKVLQKAEDAELTSGRGPAGIAAAALYVAALMNDEKKTQREVADVAGITEVTIRNRYKELLERLDLEDKLKIKENERRKKKIRE